MPRSKAIGLMSPDWEKIDAFRSLPNSMDRQHHDRRSGVAGGNHRPDSARVDQCQIDWPTDIRQIDRAYGSRYDRPICSDSGQPATNSQSLHQRNRHAAGTGAAQPTSRNRPVQPDHPNDRRNPGNRSGQCHLARTSGGAANRSGHHLVVSG